MKPRTSWDQISEDMQREDERERKALRAYLNRAKVLKRIREGLKKEQQEEREKQNPTLF